MAKFFVIDGLDGCGKQTQIRLLKDYLESIGKKVVVISFPCYESESSGPIKMYLGGQLGKDATKLNPYACSSFYAVDRYIQYVTNWGKYFEEDDNTIVLADRYLSANIIHQGVKVAPGSDQCDFAKWCYEYETKQMGLPKEDFTLVLTVKPKVSQTLLTKRYNGDESKKDIHEADLDYLNRCYDFIEFITFVINATGTSNWVHYDCTKDEDVDSIENIHEVVKAIASKYL